MAEQEYVRIEMFIRKVPFGLERTDKLIGKSSTLSKEFLDDLWEDYTIAIDELE